MNAEILERLASEQLLYATSARSATQTRQALRAQPWADPAVLLTQLWALLGQLSKTHWCVCDKCNSAQLRHTNGQTCTMTPGCRGRMERVQKPPILTKRLRAALHS